jgi:hypothetical protein
VLWRRHLHDLLEACSDRVGESDEGVGDSRMDPRRDCQSGREPAWCRCVTEATSRRPSRASRSSRVAVISLATSPLADRLEVTGTRARGD